MTIVSLAEMPCRGNSIERVRVASRDPKRVRLGPKQAFGRISRNALYHSRTKTLVFIIFGF